MGRNRRRRSRGSTTRRWFLVGGALILSGAAVRTETGAFSQLDAERLASLALSGDDDALLGLERTDSVRSGVDEQHLVDLTNNAGEPLEVALSLSNPKQGTLSDSQFSLASGATNSVDVFVARDSPTGEAALPFEVVASGEEVTVSLTRTVTVTEFSKLKYQIRDRTQNSNAAFMISYRVQHLPEFDRIEIEVENVDAGHIEQREYIEESVEKTISYPSSEGSDGGAAGHTYEFRFRVYDTSGEVTELYTETTTTADGENPPGDDLGSEDDPELVDFTVTNEVDHSGDQFTVDYEVGRLERFGEVQVEFDNTRVDWADETQSSTTAPTGTLVYPEDQDWRGGVNGDAYDVTVEVYTRSGVPVDSGTVSIEAGSDETVEWP